jgi:phosphoribosyl 1,2-cyclic phosphate phosphodiesterase
MKVTILGCGASPGVPLIGCGCRVCSSDDPKNKRSRVSVLVQEGDATLLIDTSPDMRSQCIANKIKTIDAILYTHAHADHTHGIDDIRSFNYYNNAPIPAYMDPQTEKEIRDRFSYAFLEPIPAYGWFRPCLKPMRVDLHVTDAFHIGKMEIKAFEQIHGRGKSLGYRIGNFAYSTDVNELPEKAFDNLNDLDVWVVDCLQYEPAPTHAHLDLTLKWIERAKPKMAILTHMSHMIEYEELKGKLPENITPAYDGLVIDL